MNKRQRIELAIVNMISEGIISPGECVPSIRKISQLYSVSATPVIDAYKDLERLGLLQSYPRRGFVVSTDDLSILPREFIPVNYSTNPLSEEYALENYQRYCGRGSTGDKVRYDFSKTLISPFPECCEDIVQHLSRTLKLYPKLLYTSPDRLDDGHLVDMISKHMSQYQCIVSKKEICVTNNDFVTPLLLALQSCSNAGQTAILTTPCPKSHIYAAQIRHQKVVYVRSKADSGIDLDELERVLSRTSDVACIIAAPNFQIPHGALMSNEAKDKLLEICIKYDITIIEDDSCGDLYFANERPMPLKSRAPARTIYLSSFSYSLAPELQIHWACPGKHNEFFRFYRDRIAAVPPAFLQNGFASYLKSKKAEKQLEFTRQKLRAAVEDVLNAIYDSFPVKTYASAPQGGYFIWVELPEELRGIDIKEIAMEHGIRLSSGIDWSSGADYFAVNCSEIAARPQLLKGISELGGVVTRLLEQWPPEQNASL